MGGSRVLSGLWMSVGVAFCASLAACRADPVASASDTCKVQVIVAFAAPARVPPDPHFVEAIAKAAQVNLTYVRSVNPELQVFVVSSFDGDRDCSQSLARLRGDARIRSVDVDQRRVHH